MAIPYVTNLPVSPTLTDPTNFPTRADAFMVALDGFSESCNAAIAEMNTVNDAIDGKYTVASIGGTFKGAWSSDGTYAINNVVTSNGGYWRSITGVNTTTAPHLDTVNWADADGTKADKAAVDTALAEKAPSASPAFTGTPTAPTPTAGDNSTKLATTAFVKAKSELDSIGVGQTWQNVKTSRASGVTHTNTTGKPIFLATTSGSNSGSTVIIDGLSITFYTMLFVIIPAGSTYNVTHAGGILQWLELR